MPEISQTQIDEILQAKDKFEESIQKFQDLESKINELKDLFSPHDHDGFNTEQVKQINLFGNAPNAINVLSATITTTGNTDIYILAPFDGVLYEADFSAVDALAANDTNYITFSITNLGQAGSGSTALLLAANANTTKATGGTAISANTKRSLSLSTTINALQVLRGDRLLIRVAATGTLANTVTFPTYQLRFV